MAITEEKITSVISDKALCMLDCFVSGLDKVIYDISVIIARQRTGNTSEGECARPVEIEPEDVQKAAEYIAQCIAKAVDVGEMPHEALEAINRMALCCRSHASEECEDVH